MRKNWLLKAGLVLASAGVLVGCSGEKKDDGDGTVNLGILQLMDHESLNASREGFLDVLEEAGYVEGENLMWITKTHNWISPIYKRCQNVYLDRMI